MRINKVHSWIIPYIDIDKTNKDFSKIYNNISNVEQIKLTNLANKIVDDIIDVNDTEVLMYKLHLIKKYLIL
jgi:hypothetical protein